VNDRTRTCNQGRGSLSGVRAFHQWNEPPDGTIISGGLVDVARFVTARYHFGDASKEDYAGFRGDFTGWLTRAPVAKAEGLVDAL